MNLKFFGCVLLVIGVAIGAGLLALPIATAASGLIFSIPLIILIWFIMTCCALLILEVNLRLPINNNLITMAKATLGKPASIIVWFAYLLLLYSLMAAYSAGGSDIIRELFFLLHISTPIWIDTLLFIGVLGFIVYKGIKSVDWANRGLMLTKLAFFILLILLITPHVETRFFPTANLHAVWPAIMVVVTSFGFAIVVPSLRVYLKSDKKQLYSVVLIGSFVALVCYIAWVLAIQGNISQAQLMTIEHSGKSVTGLTAALIERIHTPIIITLVRGFASICMLTSFLGVALSLTDFIADGLKLKKAGKENIIIYSVSFLPPMVIVLLFPGIFIKALSYAGIFCVIILILLPALMAWQMRKKKTTEEVYQLWGGKPLLGLIIILGFILLAIGIFQTF